MSHTDVQGFLTRNNIGEPDGGIGGLVDYFSDPQARVLRSLEYVFADVDFADTRVLDIGAGSGLHSLYAASQGATEVVALEPFLDGSEGVNADLLRDVVSSQPEIRLVEETFQAYDLPKGFDVIISIASINHLDEAATRELQQSERACDTYRELFSAMEAMLNPGGVVVVADVSRHNLFRDLHLPNPIARSIDWEIHQPPAVWEELLTEQGFRRRNLRWDSAFTQFGSIAEHVTGNRVLSYMTNSHFVLTMKKS